MIGECRGWDVETELLSHWQQHRDLFPHIPSQSCFNRRRRNLWEAFNLLRRIIVHQMDLAQDGQWVIDSLPVPVVQFYWVSGSTGDWSVHGAAFGKVPSKKQTIFGYKLSLLIALGGLIIDLELAPANVSELEVGFELLSHHTDLDVLGDKAFVSVERAAVLWHRNRLRLRTVLRRNQKVQLPAEEKRLINAKRQIIETVNARLSGQFHIERNHAHTFAGLCMRLYARLTAHTLSICLSRLLGNPDFLQIKSLTFAIIRQYVS